MAASACQKLAHLHSCHVPGRSSCESLLFDLQSVFDRSRELQQSYPALWLTYISKRHLLCYMHLLLSSSPNWWVAVAWSFKQTHPSSAAYATLVAVNPGIYRMLLQQREMAL